MEQLHQQRFAVMTKGRFTIEMQPDIATAVDLHVCRRASLYAGNLYSAFSFLLRESKLAAGESERSLYYNLEAELPLDDLTAVENAEGSAQIAGPILLATRKVALDVRRLEDKS